MIATLRSEIRKILTLRSTYIIFGFAVLMVLLMNGWVAGFKHGQLDDNFTASIILDTIKGISSLLGIMVLLQITQEYRHNTIYYTLTLARRRTTVFIAKVIAASGLMFAGAAILTALGVLSARVGLAASGASLSSQSIPWSEVFVNGGMYVWGAGMFALIIGFLVRNQVGSIVLYLFGVNTAELLAQLLLKENTGYLPFRSLEGVMMQVETPGFYAFSPEKSLVIVLCWIAAMGLAAWLLFVRRDAN